MSMFTKSAIVVAVISAGAFVSQSTPGADDVPLARAILKKEAPSAEEKILAALDKPTSVEFLDLALEDCLTYLKEYHSINVWVDKPAITEEGISLDQPVTLKLADVRLESILNLLLEPLQLDWVVQDEVLRITSSAWTYDHPEVRTYDVENLIDAGHTPEELIAAISKCVEPGTWTGKDATAGISHTGAVLVVRHTQRAHSEVARLIADLDDIAKEGEEHRHGEERPAVVSVKVYSTGNQPAEKIAEALQDFVVAASWKNHGGQGEVRAVRGALIVRQTANVHRSVQQFLAQLEPQSQATVEDSETPSTPTPATRSSQDPFGVLGSPGRPTTGAGKGSRVDRPKSPMKKQKRTVANFTVPAKGTD